ncbi:hypothetical protein GQL56_00375 [Pseudomonas putida]|nr:hypothetical protein [Pseudomonas putida]
MNSISGVAVPAPATMLPLNLYGVGARQIEKAASKTAVEQHRGKLRKARQDTELQAIEYAGIMMRKHIEAALDPTTDPKLARQLRLDIMERGLGRVREVESENAEAKRQGTNVNDLLTVLAALSSQALESQQQQRLERDVSKGISTDEQAAQFLADLERGTTIDGDCQDE